MANVTKREILLMLQILRDRAYGTFVDDIENSCTVVKMPHESYDAVMDELIYFVDTHFYNKKKGGVN